ncbi:MAG: hypothetical protein JXR95_05775 [Deltaproteobacteria bacterium]|nr:hypothetical protein [Deltaproteobacteria bacterium]
MDMDFSQVKSKFLTAALRVVNDPRVMKLISHPTVMNMVTKGLNFKDKIDATVKIWKEDN